MFIKLIDGYGDIYILNKNNIIRIRKHLSAYDEVETHSVIEYGVGCFDAIYMKETVEELNEKYKFVGK